MSHMQTDNCTVKRSIQLQ